METPQISKEELSLYLPNSLIQDVLTSPTSLKGISPITSPQIPPLESRLHSYLLKEHTRKQPQCQLNLADIFESLQVQEEIEKEIQNMNNRDVSLFNAMKQDQIFEQAEKEITEFLKSNKENIQP